MERHFNHRAWHDQLKAREARPAPAPMLDPTRVLTPVHKVIMPRDASSSSAASCTSTTDCVNSMEAANNTPLIIGLGIAIPLAIALILFYFLHRRMVGRQRKEEANDPHKSLDFGIDPTLPIGKKGRRGGQGARAPEMTDMLMGEKSLRGMKGTSLDLANPYLLPPEVSGSTPSLHSLSRTLADDADPYHIVASTSHSQLPRHSNNDDSSSQRTSSTQRSGTFPARGDSTTRLIPQAEPIARTRSPLSGPSPSGQQASARAPAAGPALARKEVSVPTLQQPVPTHARGLSANGGPMLDMPDFSHSTASPEMPAYEPRDQLQRSVDVNAANRHSSENKSLPATPHTGGLRSPPARGKSPHLATNNAGPVNPYDFQEVLVPPSPTYDNPYGHYDHSDLVSPPPHPYEDPSKAGRMTLGLGLGLDMPGNRMSIMRPLPPDDPTDNPEQRANRIRSFYKEYFSDDAAAKVHDASTMPGYYEDYGEEYLADGTVFDPTTGQFVVAHAQAPYAEPVMRRAMTPPPRGPPRFRGGPGPSGPGSARGFNSQNSSPVIGGRSRAFSSASGGQIPGLQGARGRPLQKKPLAPPVALRTLPTPHMLKEDAFILPIDFAPANSYKERQRGIADSPRMENRPYSPAVPIASPLVSSFMELGAVPSPHALRRSGTFTALDFAPPPRFRENGMESGSGSDTGSMRSGVSGRSNFSAKSEMTRHNIRNGAYRVSRIPKEFVPARVDMGESLRPRMDMVSKW